jgi:hypothetical protein
MSLLLWNDKVHKGSPNTPTTVSYISSVKGPGAFNSLGHNTPLQEGSPSLALAELAYFYLSKIGLIGDSRKFLRLKFAESVS